MNIGMLIGLLVVTLVIGAMMPLIMATVGGLYSYLYTVDPVAAFAAILIPLFILIKIVLYFIQAISQNTGTY
jgi:vacuolar-type H+-ATPase subunit I/STV1